MGKMNSINSYIQALRSGRYSFENLHVKIGGFEIHVHKKDKGPLWFQMANNVQSNKIRL